MNDHLSKLESSLHGKNGLTLRLFSDACCSQNKNMVMVCLLARFIERSTVFKRAVHIFPVRGHSYLPPDWVFGCIEKALRKGETIVSPSEYHKILGEHGDVRRWGLEWQSRDYQTIRKKPTNLCGHSKCRNKRFLSLTSFMLVKLE